MLPVLSYFFRGFLTVKTLKKRRLRQAAVELFNFSYFFTGKGSHVRNVCNYVHQNKKILHVHFSVELLNKT